jgi:hypothetical protein
MSTVSSTEVTQLSDNTKLELLIQEVRALRVDVRENTDEQKVINRDHEDRIRKIESKLTQLGERLTLWQIFQTSLTAIASGVAVFFGRQP